MNFSTTEAIVIAYDHQGQKISFIELDDTHLITNDGDNYNLIINGSHALGFEFSDYSTLPIEDIVKHVENEIKDYARLNRIEIENINNWDFKF